ncbi:MAG: MFS transporter [Actinobacteria bacterium]|nr:MFS transporter [Actinomycetota bacterium]
MSVIDRLQQRRGRFLVVLGLPALALSLAVTTVSGLLPVIVAAQAGPLVAGALVAIEGVFALIVPLVVGPLSDRTGRRLPYLAGAGAVAAAALVVIGLSGPLLLIAVAVAVFYVAYFAFVTPYYALFPDLVGKKTRGRSQGSLGTWREIGLGVGFVAGPTLLALWRPAPFVLAATVILVITPLFGAVVARRLRASGNGRPERRAPSEHSAVRRLLAEHRAIRWFVVANALWELALAALRAFVVLFLTVGLGRPESFASLVLGIVVVAALIAAPLAGWLGDRFGQRRVLVGTLWVYGIGLLLPAVSASPYVLPLVFAGALAAVTVMTLPYALLMDLLPQGDHGSAAAVYGFSRGVGLLAGPLLAGLAIVTLEPVFASSDGYAAIFPVASLAVLASIPLLRRSGAIGRDDTQAPSAATT